MYRYKSFRRLSRFAIQPCLLVSVIFLFNNCSSNKPAIQPPPDHPIQLRVENNSSTVIDVIQAKPCGAAASGYKPQMNTIKPQERIMLQIYEHCVDLVALDAFGNVMDELAGLRLNTNITWKIK